MIERLRADFAGKLKPEIKEQPKVSSRTSGRWWQRLTLHTVPPDATIKIDGKDVGQGRHSGLCCWGLASTKSRPRSRAIAAEHRTVKLVLRLK